MYGSLNWDLDLKIRELMSEMTFEIKVRFEHSIELTVQVCTKHVPWWEFGRISWTNFGQTLSLRPGKTIGAQTSLIQFAAFCHRRCEKWSHGILKFQEDRRALRGDYVMTTIAMRRSCNFQHISLQMFRWYISFCACMYRSHFLGLKFVASMIDESSKGTILEFSRNEVQNSSEREQSRITEEPDLSCWEGITVRLYDN